MGIPVMTLFPEVAAPQAGSGSGARANQGDAFATVLAAQPKAPTGDGHQTNVSDDSHVITQPAGGDQLQKLLGSLTDGKVDLKAPGLGLTTEQQEALAAKLEKLLKSGDGAELLASLLGAGQVQLNAADLLALTKLLGTSAQGTISDDALQGNLHLLAQAIQVMANSGGKMTLVQAVQELTSASDAFAKQLASALEAIPIDTGPPRAPDSGEDSRDGPEGGGSETSATAGSNGREMTVSQVETSPADGAAEEAEGSQTDGPNVQLLAEVLEALVKAEGESKAQSTPNGQAAVTTSQVSADASTAQAASAAAADATATAAQAAAGAAQAVAQADQAKASASASDAADAAFDAQLNAVVAQAQATVGQSGSGPTTANSEGSPDKDSSKELQAVTSDNSTELANPTMTLTTVDQVQFEAQAQPPVRAAVEQAIVDQVVQHAAIALRDGIQEFQIQLKPEFLGALDVRVSVDNGVAVVRMAAENAATRQLIDANIGQLRQAFGTGEVRVEHVPHFASSDQTWTFGDGNGQHTFWQGQNPFDGSSRLPEAIPFNGEPEEETELAAVGAAQNAGLTTQDSNSTVTPSGGIDLQA